MENSKYQNVILWGVLFLIASALAAKKVISMNLDALKKSYFDSVAPALEKVKAALGVDVQFPFLQAAHESNWGRSELTRIANNHFGMTAGSQWEQAMRKEMDFPDVPIWTSLENGHAVTYFKSREYSKKPPDSIRFWSFPGDIVNKQPDGKGGSILDINIPFRRYANAEESFLDWAKHMQTPLYLKALAAAKAGNFPAFAQALQNAGYGTDPNYASSLVGLYNSVQPEATA